MYVYITYPNLPDGVDRCAYRALSEIGWIQTGCQHIFTGGQPFGAIITAMSGALPPERQQLLVALPVQCWITVIGQFVTWKPIRQRTDHAGSTGTSPPPENWE